MSFNIRIVARSTWSARQKLHEAYAPAAVKALIEKALDALPAPIMPMQAQAGRSTDGEARAGAIVGANAVPQPPELIGVLIEAWGHIAEPGDHGKSMIERFVVQPLFD